jgi:hypothetical protein
LLRFLPQLASNVSSGGFKCDFSRNKRYFCRLSVSNLLNMRFPCRFLSVFFGLAFSLHTATLQAQVGCTDPQATNYDPLALQNDGSCLYASTFYSPTLQCTLPNTLKEISGIRLAENRWWVHNDSGHEHEFYSISPDSGTILQTVKLKSADNQDWEDITASPNYLYIGDIGNNNGNRTDLGVYKVKLSDIGTAPDLEIDNNDWDFVPYAYDDQTDFNPIGENQTEYDCEAMLHFQSELHLFTKKWISNTTTHYRINQNTDIAETIESFDVQGLITGADVSPDKKTVALIGYNLSGFPTVFMWLFWDFPDEHFFSGNKRRIELGTPLTLGKAEGIGFADNCKGFISNEVLDYPPILVNPGLHQFDICQWITETSATHDANDGSGFSLYPNPFSQIVHFQYFTGRNKGSLQVFDSFGKQVLTLDFLPEQLDLSALPAGPYFFQVNTENRIYHLNAIKK